MCKLTIILSLTSDTNSIRHFPYICICGQGCSGVTESGLEFTLSSELIVFKNRRLGHKWPRDEAYTSVFFANSKKELNMAPILSKGFKLYSLVVMIKII